MIQINEQQVFTTLRSLNVPFEDGSVNSKNDMPVLCPFHNDNNFGSAFINLSNGLFHCFACANSGNKSGKNLIDIVKHIKGVGFKDAIVFIGIDKVDTYESKISQLKKAESVRKRKEKKNSITHKRLSLVDFEPEKYRYTHERGFDYDFLKKYKVKLCDSGWYKNYIIIPIKDRKNNVNTFEARKLKQHEFICDFLDLPYKISSDRSKSKLKKYLTDNNIKPVRGKDSFNKVKIDEEIYEVPELWYMLKPKVLYPADSNLDVTLFNIDKLDFDNDIYISEGIASLPKLSKVFDNVTSVFGTSITNEQLELLSKFKKRKIFIPDNDTASHDMIYDLGRIIENVYVLPVKKEDTDIDFVNELKESEPVSAIYYVTQQLGVYQPAI